MTGASVEKYWSRHFCMGLPYSNTEADHNVRNLSCGCNLLGQRMRDTEICEL
jgi:hypothetical protein